MRILLTGFEPFGGRSRNPSDEIARALDGEVLHGLTVVSRILPVDTRRAPRLLNDAIASVQPQAVVCLGEAARRQHISIERVAVNLLDFRIPDNAGHHVVDQPIDPAGPAAVFATLPVRLLHDALQSAGVPVELSLSAGAYLCNQVMYHALCQLEGTSVPAGFVHLPRSFAGAEGSLDDDLPVMRDGVRLLLTTLAQRLTAGSPIGRLAEVAVG